MVEVEKGEVVQKKFVGSRLKLYTAVVLVDLLYVSTGCVLTWPSPMLSNLLRNNIITVDESSWVGSIMPLGAALGPITNSVLSPRLGRKNSLIINGALFLASWGLLTVGTEYNTLLVGRFIGGIAAGFSFNSIPVYLTEIADDHVRQAVTSLAEFFIGFGYILEFCLGPFLPYRLVQVISAVAVIIFIVPFFWMPETPYHLLMKGEDKRAIESLSWFRGGTTEQVTPEFSEIQKSLKEVKSNINPLTELKKRGPRRAFLYSFMVLTLQQISGVNVIVSYNELILETTKLPFSAAVGAMIFGVVNIIASAFAPPLVKRFGSKMVLISCSIIMGLSLELFAVNSFIEDRGYYILTASGIPVITLVIYNIFFCLGMGPIPWSVIAELSPPDFRGFISASVSTYSWLFSFGLMKAYTPVKEVIGIWPIFVLFGTGLLLGGVIVFWILPDTKHMSLGEIQLILDKKNNVIESVHM